MFWGLILKSNKKYSQTLKSNFHLSQATLDRSSAGADDVQVMIVVDNESFLLCTLHKNDLPQCHLDYNFYEGQKVCFIAKGAGIVHLTGFLMPDEEDMYGSMDEDEEDDETSLTEAGLAALKRAAKGKDVRKKIAKELAAEDEEEESDDPDYSNGKIDESNIDDDSDDDEDDAAAEGSDSDEDEDDEDNDDEEDDDDDDDDEEEDEEEIKPPNAKKLKQNGLENGNKASTKNAEKDKKQQAQQKGKDKAVAGKPRTIQGGVVVEDVKVGEGKEVTSGKKIQVWYEGRLKSNNKVFDSTKQGAGFKFTAGGGQVIKAWDVGVLGMKVGGKRRITCPPAMAYGQRGQPPVIPGNATLVFDVELRNVL